MTLKLVAMSTLPACLATAASVVEKTLWPVRCERRVIFLARLDRDRLCRQSRHVVQEAAGRAPNIGNDMSANCRRPVDLKVLQLQDVVLVKEAIRIDLLAQQAAVLRAGVDAVILAGAFVEALDPAPAALANHSVRPRELTESTVTNGTFADHRPGVCTTNFTYVEQ